MKYLSIEENLKLQENQARKTLSLPDIPTSESDIVIISGSSEGDGIIDIGFWPLPIASCSLSSMLLLFSSEPIPLSK